jgi:hypothetical protein
LIHENKKISQAELYITDSKRVNRDKKKAMIIANVDRKHAPEVPIKRPKQIQEIKLKKGNTRIQRYIIEIKRRYTYEIG